jgi:hypothetical protein
MFMKSVFRQYPYQPPRNPGHEREATHRPMTPDLLGPASIVLLVIATSRTPRTRPRATPFDQRWELFHRRSWRHELALAVPLRPRNSSRRFSHLKCMIFQRKMGSQRRSGRTAFDNKPPKCSAQGLSHFSTLCPWQESFVAISHGDGRPEK